MGNAAKPRRAMLYDFTIEELKEPSPENVDVYLTSSEWTGQQRIKDELREVRKEHREHSPRTRATNIPSSGLATYLSEINLGASALESSMHLSSRCISMEMVLPKPRRIKAALLGLYSWMLRKWNRFFSIGQMSGTFASTLVLARDTEYIALPMRRCWPTIHGSTHGRSAATSGGKRPLRTVRVRCYGTTYRLV
jgi:hypothetical protein